MKAKLLFGLLLVTATAFGQAGANDPTFNTGPEVFSIGTIAALPDGKSLILAQYPGSGQNDGIYKLNSDGSTDPDFDLATDHIAGIINFTLMADGKILAVGKVPGDYQEHIVRFNSDGSFDPSFNSEAQVGYSKIALQSDGKILYASLPLLPDYKIRIFRLNSDGSPDGGFDPGIWSSNGSINCIAPQPDGMILLGGDFDQLNGSGTSGIARLNSDGSIDPGFTAPTFLDIEDIAIRTDGKIVAVGFPWMNGVTAPGIAQLNNDGTLDTSFQPGTGANGTVFVAAIQTDEKILIGGLFDTYDGVERNYFAQLNGDGSLDSGFDPGSGPNSYVQNLAIQPDGKILIGGPFNSYDGTARKGIARILSGSSSPSINLSLTTDLFGSETTWELTKGNGTLIAAGGPYPDGSATVVNEHIPVDEGCYRFLLHDAGGNGITGGGYVLTDRNGHRIIDANGDFGSLSAIGSRFCLPLGSIELAPENCDEMDHAASEPVVCTPVYGATGYEFWAFDPHGSYQARFSTSNSWNLVRPWRLATLPVDLELNVRVRPLFTDSSHTEFGPACRLMITGSGMAPQELRSLLAGQGANLQVSPNPVSGGSVQISLDGLSDQLDRAQLDVYDAVGRQSLSIPMPVLNGSLNSPLALDNLINGLYLIRITAGDQTFTSRLMVQQ